MGHIWPGLPSEVVGKTKWAEACQRKSWPLSHTPHFATPFLTSTWFTVIKIQHFANSVPAPRMPFQLPWQARSWQFFSLSSSVGTSLKPLRSPGKTVISFLWGPFEVWTFLCKKRNSCRNHLLRVFALWHVPFTQHPTLSWHLPSEVSLALFFTWGNWVRGNRWLSDLGLGPHLSFGALATLHRDGQTMSCCSLLWPQHLEHSHVCMCTFVRVSQALNTLSSTEGAHSANRSALHSPSHARLLAGV